MRNKCQITKLDDNTVYRSYVDDVVLVTALDTDQQIVPDLSFKR